MIADDISSHKIEQVTDCIAEHPNVQPHFSPTYPSWLNQVGPWFARNECNAIARDALTSVADLTSRHTFSCCRLLAADDAEIHCRARSSIECATLSA